MRGRWLFFESIGHFQVFLGVTFKNDLFLGLSKFSVFFFFFFFFFFCIILVLF